MEEVAGDASGEGAAEDATARAARKRYEVLLAVRSKATVKGKGAWYWAHLEPVLVSTGGGGGGAASAPTVAKLRCCLCSALFSASNPSRTASEHLKRGVCPNFPAGSPAAAVAGVGSPRPISSLPPPPRKRRVPLHPSSAPPAPPRPREPVVLSGGKSDLGALAMLEESVRRLRSPKAAPAPALPEPRAGAALALLADWLLESGGAVSPASLRHPKFQYFLRQVGLPAVNPSRFAFPRLDARFDELQADVDARVRDAAFFQLSSNGWKSAAASSEHALVSIAVNLPDGTTLFYRSVLTIGRAPSGYAEEVLSDAAAKLCGGTGALADRCTGIVADRFNTKALRNLESKHQRMVNLSCQVQALHSLLKDFTGELQLFRRAAANCSKLANFFNGQSEVRSILTKHQLEYHGHARLLRCSSRINDHTLNSTILEDIMNNARPLQMVVLDADYKLVCVESSEAREVAELVQNVGFWTELEAALSLVKLIKTMVGEMEVEPPLVAQCLPVWEELRTKVKDWCTKYGVDKGPVEDVVEKRFTKNYHPAWSAAFVLDPVYLVKDTTGKYLPPFRCLTPEQEKDVDRLITRLVSPEEAHIALMELMKWRSEGLDPLYAQAVQAKQQDPSTGKMRMANAQSRRLVWETCLNEFKSLRKVAIRLIFLHAASCRFEYKSSLLQWMFAHRQSEVAVERGLKMAFLTACSKIERKNFSEEEKDMVLYSDDEDDALHEPFSDV